MDKDKLIILLINLIKEVAEGKCNLTEEAIKSGKLRFRQYDRITSQSEGQLKVIDYTIEF